MTLTQSEAPGPVLAGPISQTTAYSTRIISKFSLFHCIVLLFNLLTLVRVEILLFLVVTLSQNTITCFLESS